MRNADDGDDRNEKVAAGTCVVDFRAAFAVVVNRRLLSLATQIKQRETRTTIEVESGQRAESAPLDNQVDERLD